MIERIYKDPNVWVSWKNYVVFFSSNNLVFAIIIIIITSKIMLSKKCDSRLCVIFSEKTHTAKNRRAF